MSGKRIDTPKEVEFILAMTSRFNDAAVPLELAMLTKQLNNIGRAMAQDSANRGADVVQGITDQLLAHFPDDGPIYSSPEYICSLCSLLKVAIVQFTNATTRAYREKRPS
jgi:hypothetical protein